MKTSKLFHNCAYDVPYETVGNDVNYAFVEKKNTLYIYFQGSNSVTDWIRNFLFRKRPYKDMKIPYRVHRGFLKAWKEVEDIVINKILEEENNEFKWKHIVVVGYSHGGALAAFCHECVWFYRRDLRDGGLIGYGFEAPRIYASFKVRKELEERWENFFVIRNGSDIVTHCPPAIFGYTHVGSIINIKGDISLVKEKVPTCVKYHFPQAVYDGLLKWEEGDPE